MATGVDINNPPHDLIVQAIDEGEALRRILAFITKLGNMEPALTSIDNHLNTIDGNETYRDVVVGGTITPFTQSYNAAATHTLITPAANRRLKIWWWMWNTSSANLASVNFGFRWTAAGADFLNWQEVGGNVAVGSNMRAGKMYAYGGLNQALCLNVSAAQRITVNILYQQV